MESEISKKVTKVWKRKPTRQEIVDYLNDTMESTQAFGFVGFQSKHGLMFVGDRKTHGGSYVDGVIAFYEGLYCIAIFEQRSFMIPYEDIEKIKG